MIRSLFVVPLVVVASLAVFGACGGDDETGLPLSRDEYFRELEEPINQLQDSLTEFEPDLSDDPSDEERHAAVVAFYEQVADVQEELAAALASITPPVALVDMHAEFVAANEASADVVRGIAKELRVTYPADIIVARDDALADTNERLKLVCAALEEESAGAFSCDEDGDVVGGSGICITSDGVADCPSDGAGSEINIAPGINGRLRDVPPLPERYEALSRYIVFEVEDPGGRATIGLPLEQPVDDASDLGWYSYQDDEWRRLDVPVRLLQDGSTAEGDFDAVPTSLIVLRER